MRAPCKNASIVINSSSPVRKETPTPQCFWKAARAMAMQSPMNGKKVCRPRRAMERGEEPSCRWGEQIGREGEGPRCRSEDDCEQGDNMKGKRGGGNNQPSDYRGGEGEYDAPHRPTTSRPRQPFSPRRRLQTLLDDRSGPLPSSFLLLLIRRRLRWIEEW